MPTDNEVRGSKLAERVEEIEKLIRSGAAVPGTSLASLLNTAQAQLDANRLEDEHASNEKKEKEAKDRSAIAQMVERETKLNEEEKKKYAEFLAKDYFTKSDFADLSRFYADGGAYDRLSDEGKAQMSDRIQEGIDRGKYSRDDLPSDVRRKDAEFKGLPNQTKQRDGGAEASREASDSELQSRSATQSTSEVDAAKAKGSETNATPQASKRTVADGLAGLAGLSPVQDTDEVNIPQLRKSGWAPELGG